MENKLAIQEERIIERELRNYPKYKMEILEPSKRLYLATYFKRITLIVNAIDEAIEQTDKKAIDMIQKVLINNRMSITTYAIENYIDLSTAYRWRRKFIEEIAYNLGYLKE